MDYWGKILQKYLSYSAVRYVLTGFATVLFILLMLIVDRKKHRKEHKHH